VTPRPLGYLVGVDIRASDADREATVERLRVAATEGRLEPDELEARLATAYRSRWISELERLTVDVTPPAPSAPVAPTFVRPAARTNGFAVASFVLGLLWMWWLGSALAVVFGHVALSQIRRSGGAQGGRGLAIAGLSLGYFGALTLLLVLMFATV
jgi:Domain of unknown function (DUF4190)/Domain of unknown function (DUF1707)